MHKGVILLVKVNDRTEAEDKVNEFMEPYGDGDVWDWFVIGGRWTGELTGYKPEEDPRNIQKCYLCAGTGTRPGGREQFGDEWFKSCNGCNGCAGTGSSVKWPTNWVQVDDNIMPCSDKRVEAKIAEWSKDWEAQRLKDIAKSKESFKGDKSMQAYLTKKEAIVKGDKFCFDSNVYDVENQTNTPPKDLTGYWAVMVDMHN